MCGRFTNTSSSEAMQFRFDLDAEVTTFQPRYNIAPTQTVPVVIEDRNAQQGRRLVQMRWGLVPVWAKDMSIGNRMINARSETLIEKVSFKQLFQKKRCLIPADGFYEWKKNGSTKQPMRIVLKSRQLFGFAGLWSAWKNTEGNELQTFTIITTEPNTLTREIHNRMPVILKPENEKDWLDSKSYQLEKLKQFLMPYPSEEMTAYPVSGIVNNPNNDESNCIAAVDNF